MKTGTIVYLAGADTLPKEFDVDQAVGLAGWDPRLTELSGAAPGYYQPEEALLALAQRGAARVELVRAAFDSRRGLVLGAERTRLVG